MPSKNVYFVFPCFVKFCSQHLICKKLARDSIYLCQRLLLSYFGSAPAIIILRSNACTSEVRFPDFCNVRSLKMLWRLFASLQACPYRPIVYCPLRYCDRVIWLVLQWLYRVVSTHASVSFTMQCVLQFFHVHPTISSLAYSLISNSSHFAWRNRATVLLKCRFRVSSGFCASCSSLVVVALASTRM